MYMHDCETLLIMIFIFSLIMICVEYCDNDFLLMYVITNKIHHFNNEFSMFLIMICVGLYNNDFFLYLITIIVCNFDSDSDLY